MAKRSNQIAEGLEVALDVAARLGPVLPLCWPVGSGDLAQCGCGENHQGRDIGKAPIGRLAAHGWKSATTDLRTIERWWAACPAAGVGLALESAGLIVIDPDSDAAIADAERRGLPPTLVRISRMPAYLYRRPPSCPATNITQNGPSEKLDVLGTGYLVVYGRHRCGVKVYLDSAEQPAPCVDWAVAMLRAKASERDGPRRATADDAGDEPPVRLGPQSMERWRGEVVETTADGQLDRSTSLFFIGLDLAEGGATRGTIIDALRKRDVALGWNKYSERRDDAEYERIADKALDRQAERADAPRFEFSRNGREGSGGAPSAGAPVDAAADDEVAGELRPIRVNGRFLRSIAGDAVEALKAANEPTPQLLRRGDVLIQLVGDTGNLEARPVRHATLKGLVDRAADFVKVRMTKSGPAAEPARPPDDVVADILAMARPPFPPLLEIARTPVVLADGRVLRTPGYDRESGFLLDLLGLAGVRDDLPVTECVTLLLDELLADFPFTDAASRAHAVGMVVQRLVRALIDGPTPMYLIDAPAQGTGKGLLAEIGAVIVDGQPAPVMSLSKDDAETEKRVTALLVQGARIILLDNVTEIRSSQIAAALTAQTWRGRILGQSKVVSVPNTATWLATGNNVDLSKEMSRRVIPIRLDAGVEHPEDRTNFKHRLPEWAIAHRPRLVSACLSLVSTWLDAGRPSGDATLGRYEAWAAVIGGILKVAGIAGFLENRADRAHRADRESQEWTAMCSVWWAQWGQTPVTAGDLLKLASERQILTDIYAGRAKLSAVQRLGHALAARRDQVFGEWTVRAAGQDARTHSAAYRLERGTPKTTETTETTHDQGGDAAGFCAPEPQNPDETPQTQPDADQIEETGPAVVSVVSVVLDRPVAVDGKVAPAEPPPQPWRCICASYERHRRADFDCWVCSGCGLQVPEPQPN